MTDGQDTRLPIRHRLSSLDLLDSAAVEDLQWAFDRILEGRTKQSFILATLNSRLKDKGLYVISRAAFYRWSMNVRSEKIRRPRLIESDGTNVPPLCQSFPSAQTKKALAVFLRSLADDLEQAGTA